MSRIISEDNVKLILGDLYIIAMAPAMAPDWDHSSLWKRVKHIRDIINEAEKIEDKE